VKVDERERLAFSYLYLYSDITACPVSLFRCIGVSVKGNYFVHNAERSGEVQSRCLFRTAKHLLKFCLEEVSCKTLTVKKYRILGLEKPLLNIYSKIF